MIQPEQSNLRWYQGLDRYCWVVLIIAALGWLFDTMDQHLFTLVRSVSLEELMAPLSAHIEDPVERTAAIKAAAKAKGGLITSIFLLGWAAGGFIFGILGDRLGRTRTMMITILIYAIFTGASGLAKSWEMYAVMRFLTGLGVGGEWAAGAALVAETFPQRSRPMALGFLQALSAVGNMMASVVFLTVSEIADISYAWRWVFFVGAAPALLVLWIRMSLKEPEAWKQAQEKAHAASKEMGSMLELFTNRLLRRNTIAGILLGTAGVGALWGVGFFSPDMLRGELVTAGFDEKRIARFTGIMFFFQQLGAFFGIYLFAVVAERFGRRGAFYVWFSLAWVSVLAFFWGLSGAGATAAWLALILAPLMGFCTLGPFAGFTVYFPELFPTRLRTTGCGLCYNAARVLAALAPFTVGSLAAWLGTTHGYRHSFAIAATVVSFIYILGFIGAWLGPETMGKPLPEDKDFEEQPEPELVA
jgi:MFS family permease